MYTDPKRLKATDAGSIDNNPLWVFHDIFNQDKAWVQEAKERYKAGQIGDVECKRRLIDVLVAFIDPIRLRRREYENNLDYIKEVLTKGAEKAQRVASSTLLLAKEAMNQRYDK